MAIFREFTRTDYMGWSDALGFAGGQVPCACNLAEGELIVAGNGLEFATHNHGYSALVQGEGTLMAKAAAIAVAVAFAACLAAGDTLEDTLVSFGFEEAY